MSSLLLIILSAVLVNVIVLARVPALRPFVTPHGVFDGARGLALCGLLAIPVVAGLGWLLTHLVLEPLRAGYLRTPAFVALILIVVPFLETALERHGRYLPQRPGFTLLMTTNAAVLGMALDVDARFTRFIDALPFALGAATFFAALLLAFAALHERLRQADVPAPFREAPLALVTTGIIALAFMGFTGLIQD